MTALLALLLAAPVADSSARPRVVETVEAEVPAWARGTGLSTHVSLRVLVARDGRAGRIEVVPYSTRRDLLSRAWRASFDSAAVRAVRRWRFDPARRSGRPVAAWLAVEVPVAEPWTRAPGGAVIPDSLRSPTLWYALMGEWWRLPIRRTPFDRASAIRFRRDGRYTELDAAGREREGRFEVSSDGSADDPEARLTRIPSWAGGTRRIERLRFAGRDTLILCTLSAAGSCDTFVATARGARP